MAIRNQYSPVYNFSDKATYDPTVNDDRFFTPERPNRNRSINTINEDNPVGIKNNYRGLYGNKFGADSQFSNAEQTILLNMSSECISANGVTVRYMTRRAPPGVGPDLVFNEIPESQFDTGLSIDCWIQNIEGFEGDNVISLYGLEIREEVDIIIAVQRFNELIYAYDSEVFHRGDSEYVRTRPLEGDLVAIPFGISAEGGFDYVAARLNNPSREPTPQYFPKLFEVLKVSTFRDGPFFQYGANQTYKLHCRLFELSGETINFDSEFSDYPPNEPDASHDSTLQFILDELRAYDSDGEVPHDSDGSINITQRDWADRYGRNQPIEENSQLQDIYANFDSEIDGKQVAHTYVAKQTQNIVQDYGRNLYSQPGVINDLDEI